MASNDDKKKARELLAANPDMKYTEALRAVQQGRTGEPNTKTVHWTPREPFLGFSDALGDGAPTPSAEGDDWARSALRGADLSGALRDLDLMPEGGPRPLPHRLRDGLDRGSPQRVGDHDNRPIPDRALTQQGAHVTRVRPAPHG